MGSKITIPKIDQNMQLSVALMIVLLKYQSFDWIMVESQDEILSSLSMNFLHILWISYNINF